MITILNLLVINQIPTLNPLTVNPLTLNPLTLGPIITIDPGLFTTTNPSVITRPRPTTTTTTVSSTVSTITQPITEDNTVLYIVVAVVFGLFGVFEMWYFLCRKKRNETIPENVDRLYESIDYSGVYELPKPEEYTNENPPPVPEKPQYGVRVNTII